MKKILFIFGTRPEAIKMAPLIHLIQDRYEDIHAVICSTGQHRSMLEQVLETFDINLDYDLSIMTKRQDLFYITNRTLQLLKVVLKNTEPDVVLVQGDTTTAFVASLAAYYYKIPIGHVEAGLRTYNKYSPFPEEVNRHLIGVLADYHFATTKQARNNLIKESVPKDRIWITGNTVIDALLYINKKNQKEAKKWYDYFESHLRLSLRGNNKIILVTGHRRENFGQGIENICSSLKQIAQEKQDVTIVYSVHLNPNVYGPVNNILGNIKNIRLIDPLEYRPFVFLMSRSYLILTDSGGIQEEAPSLGKPVLVMRDTTERPEGVELGNALIVGTEKNKIFENTIKLIDDSNLYNSMINNKNPYGDGKAAKRIIETLIHIH